jgi:basic membrane lipoprotein Med (substrate-binding protein (PBP1-ABC) superfamily)
MADGPARGSGLLFAGILLLSGWAGPPAAQTAPAPADPLATENARALLEWLYSLPARREKRVLSGQDIGHLDGPQGYYDYVLGLHQRVGKWPALIGTDYLNHHGSAVFLDVERKTRILADYWRSGGLVTVYAHLGNPWTHGDAWDISTGSGAYSDAYTPGTAAHAELKADFDRLVEELLKLQRAGVAVLFRPFHEVNGNWFWWHNRDPSQFKRLWRHWFGYLTREKRAHNLLFLFSPSGPPRLDVRDPAWPWQNNPWDYYPGADCVDLVGLSLYLDDPEALPIRAYREMIGLGKPFGFAEMGQSIPPDPTSKNWDQSRMIRAIRRCYPAAVFWYSWSSWEPDGYMAMVDLPNPEALMDDPWVASRDDVRFPRALAAAGGTKEASGAGRMKVGFVDYTTGQVRGFPCSFEAAWQSVLDKNGDWLEAVPVRGVGLLGFGRAVDRLVGQEGCTVIFTNAHSGYGPQILEAARRHPNVVFEAPQADPAARPANLRTCGVDDGEAQYLMGAIAGALTDSGRIGYIGWAPERWQIVNVNHFALGVQATNPKAKVCLRFDEGRTLMATQALLDQGCDVFNYAADQEPILRLFESAVSGGKRVYTFGDTTPYEAYPGLIISSQSRNYSILFERILADAHSGKEVPRDLWLSIRDGAVRLKAGSEALNPEVAAKLRSKRVRSPDLGELSAYDFVLRRFEQLRRGAFQPFTGPIRDQKGRLRLAEGTSDTDWEYRRTMDWLIDNVIGDLPTR